MEDKIRVKGIFGAEILFEGELQSESRRLGPRRAQRTWDFQGRQCSPVEAQNARDASQFAETTRTTGLLKFVLTVQVNYL